MQAVVSRQGGKSKGLQKSGGEKLSKVLRIFAPVQDFTTELRFTARSGGARSGG